MICVSACSDTSTHERHELTDIRLIEPIAKLVERQWFNNVVDPSSAICRNGKSVERFDIC